MPRATMPNQDIPGLFSKPYIVTMPNGEKWAVPLVVVLIARAESYKSEFGDSLLRSLREDTIPLAYEDVKEIIDYAKNNMDWSEAQPFAYLVKELGISLCDWQDGWVNGEVEIGSSGD